MSWLTLMIVVVIVLVVLFVVAASIGDKASKKAGARATELLNRIEEKYLEFAVGYERDYLTGQDVDRYLQEAMVLVKPEMDALVSLVNASTYSSVEVPFDSQLFPNLGTLAEESFRISQRNASKSLKSEEEKEFFTAFEEAVRADLVRRRLQDSQGNQQF